MKKIILEMMICVMIVMSASIVLALGPTNAGGNSGQWEFGEGIYIYPASQYIGPDYGAGSTETICSDGTWIDVIEEATLMAKGHYFSDVAFTDKDWVDYKFWLDKDHPVDMLLGGDTEYIATKFITLKQWMVSQEIELGNYK